MNIEDIKKALYKPATSFETGGFQPTEELGESWIGRILWEKPGEQIPPNFEPLAMLFLNTAPHVPRELAEFQLINIYIECDALDDLNFEDLESQFKIIGYTDLSELKRIDAVSSSIKPFPLKPSLFSNDTPSWDSDDIDGDIQKQIIQLECDNRINYNDDIVDDLTYSHKLGGYPAFIQGGISFDGYPFVLQISSDSNAELDIIDNGSFYFFYNQDKNDWIIYCDCF